MTQNNRGGKKLRRMDAGYPKGRMGVFLEHKLR